MIEGELEGRRSEVVLAANNRLANWPSELRAEQIERIAAAARRTRIPPRPPLEGKK